MSTSVAVSAVETVLGAVDPYGLARLGSRPQGLVFNKEVLSACLASPDGCLGSATLFVDDEESVFKATVSSSDEVTGLARWNQIIWMIISLVTISMFSNKTPCGSPQVGPRHPATTPPVARVWPGADLLVQNDSVLRDATRRRGQRVPLPLHVLVCHEQKGT